jgi:hypothetical protein
MDENFIDLIMREQRVARVTGKCAVENAPNFDLGKLRG